MDQRGRKMGTEKSASVPVAQSFKLIDGSALR